MSTSDTKTETGIPEPQKEHAWLQDLIGEWTFEGQATMEPGKPPEKFKGAESVRGLGGLWILGEGTSEMPGGCVGSTLTTLGYDPAKNKYVGTFIASMMTHLFVYEGAMDKTGSTLTLQTQGPHMAAEGKLAQYKDVIELKGSAHRVLRSYMLDDNGEWHRFMTADYRRKK